MLHAKFQDHRTSGSGDFERFYRIWARRPSWPCDHDTRCCSLSTVRLHVKFGLDWPCGFKNKDVCK